MTQEHTPGPWVVGQHPALSVGWAVKPVLFGPNVRVLPECEGGHILLRNEADAHLFAASPELLDALRDTRMAIIAIADSALEAGFGTLADMMDEVLGKANHAIAKATGQQVTA